jgi:hypothetical protein
MRAAMVALVAVFGLMALSAQVAAVPALRGVADTGSAIMPVRDGCGAGWHAQGWRDRWGYWHRRCVPNRW